MERLERYFGLLPEGEAPGGIGGVRRDVHGDHTTVGAGLWRHRSALSAKPGRLMFDRGEVKVKESQGDTLGNGDLFA
jgi:hypothetical protein